jgi:hypothetical protein
MHVLTMFSLLTTPAASIACSVVAAQSYKLWKIVCTHNTSSRLLFAAHVCYADVRIILMSMRLLCSSAYFALQRCSN